MFSEDTQDATNKKQKQGFSFSISDILHTEATDLSNSSNLNESNTDSKIEQDESVKSEDNSSVDDICCEDEAEQSEDECAENCEVETLQQNNFKELSGKN